LVVCLENKGGKFALKPENLRFALEFSTEE